MARPKGSKNKKTLMREAKEKAPLQYNTTEEKKPVGFFGKLYLKVFGKKA